MQNINLFLDAQGQWVTKEQIISILSALGVEQCDTLFVHSSLNFGVPNPALKKSELLKELLECIKAMGVRNIIMPTFTFSFCNKRSFDIQRSASKMGVLNEYFRKQDGVIRSIDPLMSVAFYGKDTDLVRNIGHHSCGACSVYDNLRHSNGVYFLMFGPLIGECLTYMHYLEWLYSVDYRYDRLFVGEVIDENGKSQHEEYTLFSRYREVIPNTNSFEYENRLYSKGLAQRIICGNAGISIVNAENSGIEYKRCLDENPYFFVELEGGKLIKDKTFFAKGEIVAM